MLKVQNYFDAVPEHLPNDQKRCETELLNRKKFNNSCWQRCKKQLLVYFHQKCAYCERPFASPQDCSIDHYRPKAVYYWLAHEWTNFLPACRFCQKTKDHHFQTENSPQTSPPMQENGLDYACCRADHAYLLVENPYFLHPVLDNPHEHLVVEIEGKKRGKLKPISPKGEYSVKYYNLNEGFLLRERKRIVNEFLDRLICEEQKLIEEGISEKHLKKAVLEKVLKSKQAEDHYFFVWQNIAIYFGFLN